MTMKRFITINLLLLAAIAEAMACAIPPTHNWYLFSVVREGDFAQRVNEQTLDNWRVYLGQEDRLFWFEADAIMAAARRKGDQLMVSYLEHLDTYLNIARDSECESWDYPTREELDSRRSVLEGLRDYATSKLDSRLRSQHALLLMRCNMLLGDHEANVGFWEQKGSKLIESVYRDMMRNIYAGALLKTGRTDEATQIFVEQGDAASLNTYYYDKRSADDIEREYNMNPDSPAMPFLLQDFANNAQEAVDGLEECNWPGKLFIRNIEKEECERMRELARRVVKDGKTSEPALWKSLEAWLEYLFGDHKKASKAIAEAMTLKGSERTMDNARVLRLYIKAQEADDDFIAQELAWIEQQADAMRTPEDYYDNHYTHVYDRLVHQVLVDRYKNSGQPEFSIALMAAKSEMAERFYEKRYANEDLGCNGWNDDYSTEFFVLIDSASTADAERYLQFVTRKDAASSALGKWLTGHITHNAEFLHEIVGTKYLREGEWQKAIEHLSQVSLDFVHQMNIAPFMAQRNYTTEPWITRQWIKEELQRPGSAWPATNQKLDFAREMMAAEQAYAKAKGAERQQQAYELAVRYYQASLYGDAWYLTEYGKSTYSAADEPKPAFVVKARELLEEAAKASDYALREHAIFALAYAPYDNWHEYKWSDKKNDFVAIPMKETQEYAAMKRLSDFARQNSASLSPYVSRCDILKQFQKQQ